MLITHDMGAVAEMAGRVLVMYAGRVIEQGRSEQLLSAPGHPYTRGLLDCLPQLGSSAASAAQPPPPPAATPGAASGGRAPRAMGRGAAERPPMFAVSGPRASKPGGCAAPRPGDPEAPGAPHGAVHAHHAA